MPGVNTAFDDFLVMMSRFKRLSFLAIGAGVAVPFVAGLASISPPWPPGVELMTAVVELLALILVFHILYRKKRRRATLVLGSSAALLIITAAAYLVLSSLLTFTTPEPGNTRQVKGLVCQSHIEETFPSQCPLDITAETLAGAGWDPDQIWTPTSIAAGRAVLTLVWMMSFIFLSSTFGAFIVYQSGQSARPDPAGRARVHTPKTTGTGK